MSIQLTAMDTTDYAYFLDAAIPSYAASKTQNGDWDAAESLSNASRDFVSILPMGLATEGHYFRNIEHADQKIGYCWYAIIGEGLQRTAYLYEIFIAAPHRNKGYGSLAMSMFIAESRSGKAERIQLHVFGYNTAALRLYQRLGFTISDYNLSLDLSK